MASIEEFYKDVATRDNVIKYLQLFLENKAVKKVFDREDIAGVAEAKEVIDEAFEAMGEKFDPKPEPTRYSKR